VEKYCRVGQATDEIMVHVHCTLDTSGYKHTVSVFLIIKIIRDLYRGIIDFKKVYQLRTNKYGIRRMIWLQIPTVLCLFTFLLAVQCTWG
jgi:hypothetical protein